MSLHRASALVKFRRVVGRPPQLQRSRQFSVLDVSTAIFQNIHDYSGLSWYWSIPLTGVLFRLAYVPFLLPARAPFHRRQDPSRTASQILMNQKWMQNKGRFKSQFLDVTDKMTAVDALALSVWKPSPFVLIWGVNVWTMYAMEGKLTAGGHPISADMSLVSDLSFLGSFQDSPSLLLYATSMLWAACYGLRCKQSVSVMDAAACQVSGETSLKGYTTAQYTLITVAAFTVLSKSPAALLWATSSAVTQLSICSVLERMDRLRPAGMGFGTQLKPQYRDSMQSLDKHVKLSDQDLDSGPISPAQGLTRASPKHRKGGATSLPSRGSDAGKQYH